ncbi:MAG TPA: sigma-70 family RNA polymerase sigma factor [Blastocatellia bacterium]|nr:sigma-70 family RNA polymerase sigma factor [Blastocatellia bacterium]
MSYGYEKSFGMNQDAFEKLLTYFDPDDPNNAAHEYVLIKKKLITFFESRGCYTPEEHADITLIRAAKIIDEGRAPDRVHRRRFIYRVANYVLKECWDKQLNPDIPLEDLPGKNQPTVDPEKERLRDEERMDSELQLMCLDACMANLSDQDREIIIEYYRGDTTEKIRNRRLLAERMGISIGALRLRAFRIREQLEECMRECLERSRRA